MPHIIVKMYPGRTMEQKKALTEAIREALIQSIGADPKTISLAIEEIPPSEWKEKVYDKEIVPQMENLWIKPGYTMD
ncbi:tautomerase family protein [Thermospira aquatica]|uniref:Tautomerase family protein n=1 Tax=Thermospira aquatica TaxID=2828656 RepID=A0AAX3BB07_9SPIR|nr:tautomerase family protein [Thermospira aquatica]URA09286.1 tautomerase family protein [Thermospira aquatica]